METNMSVFDVCCNSVGEGSIPMLSLCLMELWGKESQQTPFRGLEYSGGYLYSVWAAVGGTGGGY